MSQAITVKKGCKLPKPVGPTRSSRYPFATMKVNESFFLPDRTTAQFSTYASMWGRRLKRKFATRTVWMNRPDKKSEWVMCDETDKGAVQGCGVWRVE